MFMEPGIDWAAIGQYLSNNGDPMTQSGLGSPRMEQAIRGAADAVADYFVPPQETDYFVPPQETAPTVSRGYNNADSIKLLQSEMYNNFGANKKYGENFVDGRYGNNTASAMIDTLNNVLGLNISNSGTLYEKTKAIQNALKSNGFTDYDGKDLVIDGKFGKRTADAFARFMLKVKEDAIKQRNYEETQAAIMAQQQAEAQRQDEYQAQIDAANAAAYAKSPAIRAEQPNRNMFAGVNLPMPEVFARREIDLTQPIDVGYAYGGYIGRDIYGRPVYAEK